MGEVNEPEIGLTGARFGGGRRRRTRATGVDDTATLAGTSAEPPDVGEPADPAVGLTGARFGGPSRHGRRAAPPAEPPAASAPADPPVAPVPAVPSPRSEPPLLELDPGSSTSVRPYVLTGGRTRSEFELAIETLVSAVPTAGDAGTNRDIVELCRVPRSVAEIAALRGLPLGVAKVLLGDLAANGVIAVHRTADAGGPGLSLMQRVLAGLRRL